ncbi:MAG: CopG family ribbon-helix-helix protein [Gammaproteobacteria bacterium]
MNKTLSLRLDEETIEKLDLLAKATERSRGWLMARAVSQYVEHEAWQVEAVKQALGKLEDGRARFATHETVETWVESWDREDEQSPPTCA